MLHYSQLNLTSATSRAFFRVHSWICTRWKSTRKLIVQSTKLIVWVHKRVRMCLDGELISIQSTQDCSYAVLLESILLLLASLFLPFLLLRRVMPTCAIYDQIRRKMKAKMSGEGKGRKEGYKILKSRGYIDQAKRVVDCTNQRHDFLRAPLFCPRQLH